MRILRIFAVLALASVCAWFLFSLKQQVRAAVADRDSIAYWAAARLLLHHQNPYDAPAVLKLEQDAGYGSGKALVLRTPPWSLWMFLPLGMEGSFGAWMVWVAILFTSLWISIHMCWRMYGKGGKPPTVFLVVGYLFAPIPACLVAGQMGIMLLLGVALFFLLQARRPFLAGAALLIPFAKPHVLSAFFLVLALWIVLRRKWWVLGGFAFAFTLSVAVALAVDRTIFSDYQQMVRLAAIQYEFIPALSGIIRLIFFRRFFWVQFVPMGAALAWAACYYWRHRQTWDWPQHGPALLVVSTLTAPYAWLTDEAVALPAVLLGLLWIYAAKDRLSVKSQLAIFVFGCLELLLLLLLRARIPFATGIYFWSSLVWASWYWFARSFQQKSTT